VADRSSAEPDGQPKLYRELAAWWPLLSAPEDYAEEAAFYERVIIDACARPPETLLELGSGGGNNASHMKARFRMTLTDLSPDMLKVSEALNPECEHVEGDMRTLRLGREFDGVFAHDAVCYLTTEEDVRAAIETAFVHCQPGGAVLFCPDFVRENYRPQTDHGGHDGDGKALRYLEWNWDPDPTDTTYEVFMVYAMREADGRMAMESDRHDEGLFGREDWLRWMTETGFSAKVIPFEHSDVDYSAEVFVGLKPE
jgi:ubiquinone/menaquinone biosynthesis C-methylase UbiE